MEKLVLENEYKLVYLPHQIKAQQFFTDLDLYIVSTALKLHTL